MAAHQDGTICLWDIGSPAPPSYKNVTNLLLLKLKLDFGPDDLQNLYTMAWAGDTGVGWIMVGTEHGLRGWRISSRKVKETKFPKTCPEMVKLRSSQSMLDNFV